MPNRDAQDDHDENGADVVGASAPMDTLLADAGSSIGRWMPGRSGLHLARALARSPRPVVRAAREAAGELAKVAVGRSDIEPGRKDKRFADDAWAQNPLLHRVVQAYLVASKAAGEVVDNIELDWRTEKRIRFLVENVVEALAPSNNPVVNPAAWKAVIDTGGRNVARGSVAMVRDLATAPHIPRMVEPDAYQPGRDLAVTPGHVVFRNPVLELIQYTPQTETVHEIPLLIVPPTINKFYVVDLSPGRSLVEHLVNAGQHVFMVSWRNPGKDAKDWGVDRYAEAVLEALDAVESISGAKQTALLALCSGGMLTSMLMAHLAATGQQKRIAALSLLVTVLDQHKAGTPGALTDRRAAEAAVARSSKQGYLDGAALAEVFAWLRPRDLVWNYWVNNYLLGKPPPAFDILAWNSDVVRMPAKLHEDLMNMSIGNTLVEAGKTEVLGVPIDLQAITADAYVVSGENDHITPWQGGYRTVSLLGGKVDYILSRSGHIAAMVNPPTNAKATFRHGVNPTGSAADFRANSELVQGSWWPHWIEWLSARTGELVNAPAELGRGSFTPIVTAPGTYVFDK